ncbi:hypothetical protein EVAR_37706_1 [Eumeta japonica]|uniref:Uncharacterized protein n=1 Tax=Eumeta variegata TaxID=151549 RepID=A0A4C1XRB4_EUMVA|nr:hypothetical protein EVAR_37706_1 [Eumeta japonica]
MRLHYDVPGGTGKQSMRCSGVVNTRAGDRVKFCSVFVLVELDSMGCRVNWIVGVATLPVATGRHAILGYIYSLFIEECTVWRRVATLYNDLYVVKMYTVVNSTIEPSEKGVVQSLAHGDASPHRIHYYLGTVYIYSIAWRFVVTP